MVVVVMEVLQEVKVEKEEEGVMVAIVFES